MGGLERQPRRQPCPDFDDDPLCASDGRHRDDIDRGDGRALEEDLFVPS